MNTNSSKNAIIVFAAILLAAFFMPWITVFVSVNAWDLIFGSIGQAIDSPIRFLGAAIPLSSVLIIYAAGFNKEQYPIQKSFLCCIPIITLILFAIIIISKIGSNNASDINGNIIKIFGLGFWLTLVGSIVLAILGSNSPVQIPVKPVQQPIAPTGDVQEKQQIIPDAVPISQAVVSPVEVPPNSSIVNPGQHEIVKEQIVTEPAHSIDTKEQPLNKFLNQPSNLLLIASGLIFFGFFMPWVEAPAAFNAVAPTINGTYLLGQANKAENAHLILVALLLLSPVCAAIIAYDCYQKTTREKRLTICIALATYVPVFILVLYLFQFKSISRELGGVIGDSGSLGTGMLLMIAGSLYYLFYIVKNVLKDNKLLYSKAVIKHSAIGGIIPAILLYTLLANDTLRNAGPATVIGLLALLPICSIVITNNIHKKSLGGFTNYSRVIVIGFFTSIAFAIGFSLLVYLLNSAKMRDIAETGNFFWQLIASALQAGFIISAIAGIWLDRPSVPLTMSAGVQDADPSQGQALPLTHARQFELAGFAKKNGVYLGIFLVVIAGVVTWLIINHNHAKNQYASMTDTARMDSARVTSAAPPVVTPASTAASAQSAPNTSNPVSGGKFTGRFFDVVVPQGFNVRPSLTGSQDNGYSQYISAFFQSPDNQVEFYYFSGYFNEVASDVAIDLGKEKQTSILVKHTGQNEVTTWTEIKALDNSYLKAYQETKNRVTNEHKVVGLRYNTQAAYNAYKSQYLAFKKSYSDLGGD